MNLKFDNLPKLIQGAWYSRKNHFNLREILNPLQLECSKICNENDPTTDPNVPMPWHQFWNLVEDSWPSIDFAHKVFDCCINAWNNLEEEKKLFFIESLYRYWYFNFKVLDDFVKYEQINSLKHITGDK
jgi:hypothetical protein